MASSTWTWTDSAEGGLGTYSFTVQSSNSAPSSDQFVWQRNFQMELQPTPSSQPLMFEGQATPLQETLQGLFLGKAQWTNFINFFLLEHTTSLTDDNGVSRTIFPSQLTLTRMQSALYPFKASFQLVFYIFGQLTFP